MNACYLHQYTTVALGIFYPLTRLHLKNYYNLLTATMSRTLVDAFRELFFDVTEVPVERAANQDVQKLHFSGKKNSTP